MNRETTMRHTDDLQPCDVVAAVNAPRTTTLVRRSVDGALTLAFLRGDTPPAQLPTLPDIIGLLPPIYPEWLGDRSFCEAHGCRFPYVVGEMARGIATPRMVIAAASTGLMGFYGSAGLRPDTIRDGAREIISALGSDNMSWGANLIHAPQEVGYERAVVDLFLAEGVTRMSASAFMQLSKEVVRYAAAGLSRSASGDIQRKTHVFAKVSRAEVARHFLAPAPDAMLRELVAAGDISQDQADLATKVPVAEDITAESDSGGHTDNRPLGVLMPILTDLRDAICATHNYARPVRVGAAGGIATPASVAAAFQLGADYVLTGSINQSAVESGLSELGRQMLATAGPADVAMAPAADMFELGVKVQVLKRGALFAPRGNRLYELYRTRKSLHDLTPDERTWLEDKLLHETIDEAWAATRDFHVRRDAREVERAEADPKHKMALIFRRYLFMGAQWAREGVAERRADFQIWCGPAMGAFNEWVKGSSLEAPENRTVAQIGLNLMEGATRATRAHQLRTMGVPVPTGAAAFAPRPLV